MIVDLLYGVLKDPTKTFRNLSETKPIVYSIMVFAFVWFLLSMSEHTILNQGFNEELLILAKVVWAFLLLVIGALLLHLLTYLFSRHEQGDFLGLLTVLGFAQFPLILSIPLTLIGRLVGTPWSAFIKLVNLGIVVWVVVLFTLALKETYAINTTNAILCYVLLLLVPIAVMFIGLTLTVLTLVGL